ncbi:homing endonuclease associated repeat-containing protein [Halosimplex pelagicum]|uniref:Uncharacterized protein n=1 Tax=Halosimplex pelagicum TaxID=869886 RepID=A0A7D5T8D2_9EURY|nr:hypothetical protein [Halosimplex pelagicum]QLH84808.1 hypothetical protein HZS54_25670 [Halosimplex pelagicum]
MDSTSEESGDQPSATDLLSELRRLDGSTDGLPYPSDLTDQGAYALQDFQDQFGSWDEALEAAGINKRNYLLTELDRVTTELGEKPTQSEMNRLGEYSSSMYARFFGSWSSAKEQLDDWCPENHTQNEKSAPNSSSVDKEVLIGEIQRFSEALDETPTKELVASHGDYSIAAYISVFDSWENALQEAGVSSRSASDHETRKYSNVEILDAIKETAHAVGNNPTTTEVNHHTDLSAGLASLRFGSWDAAVDLAQFKFNSTEKSQKQTQNNKGDESKRSDRNSSEREPRKQDSNYQTEVEQVDDATDSVKTEGQLEYNNEELITYLKDLAELFDEPPSKEYVEAYGAYPARAFEKAFGSWAQAISAADLQPIDHERRNNRDKNRVEILDSIVEYATRIEDIPDPLEISKHTELYATTVDERFGSVSNAIEEAGITEEAFKSKSQQSVPSTQTTEPRYESPSPTADGVKQELQRLGTQPDSPPTATTFEHQSELSVVTVRDHFGTWKQALADAGYDGTAASEGDVALQGYTDSEIVEELRRVALHVGYEPTTGDFDSIADFSSQTVKNRFDSWTGALGEAHIRDISSEGIDELKSKYQFPSQSSLLDEINHIDSAISGRITPADIESFARYPAIYFREEFGSIAEAIEQSD